MPHKRLNISHSNSIEFFTHQKLLRLCGGVEVYTSLVAYDLVKLGYLQSFASVIQRDDLNNYLLGLKSQEVREKSLLQLFNTGRQDVMFTPILDNVQSIDILGEDLLDRLIGLEQPHWYMLELVSSSPKILDDELYSKFIKAHRPDIFANVLQSLERCQLVEVNYHRQVSLQFPLLQCMFEDVT